LGRRTELTTYDEGSSRIGIVEVNPRMSYQFADLMELVNNTNIYEVLFALSVGGDLRSLHRGGRHGAACSLVLRPFRDARVLRTPSPESIRAFRRQVDLTLWRPFYEAGDRLSATPAQWDGTATAMPSRTWRRGSHGRRGRGARGPTAISGVER
jgi:hypothetical protein